MKKNVYHKAAIAYYKEDVEGEPLTHEVPKQCFVEGAEFVLKKNKKNYKKALKTLEVTKLIMIRNGEFKEWLKIDNCLRMCAGLDLIEIN